MGVNFEYYKVFYEVGKFGNITMAAKSLFLTQSTVSRIIQNLEHELGVRLFSRSKKGVVLTDVGTVLFNHVSQACEHIYLGEQRVSQMKVFNEGTIRIGTVEMVMQYFLMSMIRPFRKKYPLIKMDFSFQDPSRVAAALNSGLLDLAVLTSPVDSDERTEVIPWMEFDDMMVAGNAFESLRQGEYELKELVGFPFLTMREGMSTRTYMDSLFLNEELELKPVCEVQSMPFILDMVSENLGIACVPEFYAADRIRTGEMFAIPLKKKLPSRQICIVTSKVVPGSLVRDEFIRMITE